MGITGLQNSIFSTANQTENPIIKTGRLLFVYGVSVPVLITMVQGHDIKLAIRDIIPFLFLLLPVFFTPESTHSKFIRFCLYIALFTGVLFSIRSVLDGLESLHTFLSFQTQGHELTYFANSPTVLFTALFLSGLGLKNMTSQEKSKHLTGIIYIAISLLCFLPLVITVQRASLGYAFCALVTLLCINLYTRPRPTLAVLSAILFCMFIFQNQLLHIIFDMRHKTSLVGFNARFEELDAVWNRISDSPVSLLFGTGWGGTYHSPAVGGLEVNFTHSLLSAMLLKTGLNGVLLTSAYIGVLGQRLLRLTASSPVFVLAAFGALLIPTVLYASYKSLDFGLLLLLVYVYTPEIETKKAIS